MMIVNASKMSVDAFDERADPIITAKGIGIGIEIEIEIVTVMPAVTRFIVRASVLLVAHLLFE